MNKLCEDTCPYNDPRQKKCESCNYYHYSQKEYPWGLNSSVIILSYKNGMPSLRYSRNNGD